MLIHKSKIIVLSSALLLSVSVSEASQIYSPYLMANPDRLEIFGGHCQSPSEERKMWEGINKFAKSFLNVAPQIPPEQVAYIKGEMQTTNIDRINHLVASPMYKMKEFYDSVKNIESHSARFLANQAKISLAKKMEFVGRTLANTISDGLGSGDMMRLSADLRAKGYYIAGADLDASRAVIWGIRNSLVSYLICHGERL
jgi:hypothetical protein